MPPGGAPAGPWRFAGEGPALGLDLWKLSCVCNLDYKTKGCISQAQWSISGNSSWFKLTPYDLWAQQGWCRLPSNGHVRTCWGPMGTSIGKPRLHLSLLNPGDCHCGIACIHYSQDFPEPSFSFPNSVREPLIGPGLYNESVTKADIIIYSNKTPKLHFSISWMDFYAYLLNSLCPNKTFGKFSSGIFCLQ